MRGRLIGPKTWDRIVGIFLGFSLVGVTAQKIRGCLGLLIPDFFTLNHVFVWKMSGMGC